MDELAKLAVRDHKSYWCKRKYFLHAGTVADLMWKIIEACTTLTANYQTSGGSLATVLTSQWLHRRDWHQQKEVYKQPESIWWPLLQPFHLFCESGSGHYGDEQKQNFSKRVLTLLKQPLHLRYKKSWTLFMPFQFPHKDLHVLTASHHDFRDRSCRVCRLKHSPAIAWSHHLSTRSRETRKKSLSTN